MDNTKIAFGNTLDEIDLFYVENETAISLFPLLKQHFEDSKNLNVEYKEVGGRQVLIITGSAKEKKLSRIAFSDNILNISKPAASVFIEKGNFEIADQLTCNKSLLDSLHPVELIDRGDNLFTVCTDNLQILSGAGITTPKLQILKANNSKFAALNIKPKAGIKKKADAGKELNGVRKRGQKIIDLKLSNSIYVFKGNNDLLLEKFLNVIKKGSIVERHRKQVIPTVLKTFKICSESTNEIVIGAILQAFEIPKSYTSNKFGMVINAKIPMSGCLLQIRAFGFVNYSKLFVFDVNSTETINILLTPEA